ncbi:MAG: DNA translocase FtsK, partial [Planctomycetes bacterium]|nr:DNA translocase FtsK [Planctomycetota bacterium]
ILDRNGAEKLLGAGDMLFLPPKSAELIRAQGCYVSTEEIRQVVDFVKEQGEPVFDEELSHWKGGEGDEEGGSDDPLYDQAVRFTLETQRGSASLLQRQFQLGYTRASRLIDQMQRNGIVGPYKGSQAREVLVTLEEWDKREAQGPA